MRAFLFAAFFLSGASGLAYEIAWVKRLTHVFGSTTLAISTVLAAFMGGLALGSFFVGRYADRHAGRAIRLYGTLEIGIALFAAAMPALFRAVEALYLPLAPSLADSPQAFFFAQFLLVSAVIVGPTAMMGGTLPLIARAVVARDEELSQGVGTLYAVNTVGAAFGALATNYYLLPLAGVRQTELFAAAVNAAVGLSALAVARRIAAAQPAVGEIPPDPSSVALAREDRLSPEAMTLLIGIALSGFAAMSAEVAWSRVLAMTLGSSVYSFGMMLLVFLLGLALGSALFTRLRRGQARAVAVFAWTQVLLTVALVAAILLVPRLPVLFLSGFAAVRASFGLLQVWNFLLAALLLLPSAILFGLAFPAAIAATASSLSQLGLGVGRVMAANTIGTVAGAFLAGFVLIPQLGLKATLTSAAVATAAAALAALRLPPSGRRRRPLAVAAAAALLLAPLLPPWPTRILTMGVSNYADTYRTPANLLAVSRTREVLFYKDGVNTTLSVVQGPDRYYASNGKTDASTDPGDRATQIYLGQLPMLLHPNPQDVFMIGLGTGMSAAAVARYPVRSIDIVEIEAAGRDAVRFFEAENHRILEDPRVRFAVGDGRNRLLAASKTYDVIICDPSDAWVAGVANLFTQEFYELARKRLKPGGVLVQWFQLHSLPPQQLKLIAATFRFVFPFASLWRPNRSDVILVGSVDRVLWDWPRLVQRFQTVPGVSQDLLSIGIWHPLAVFAAYVCDGQELGSFLRGVARPHTDDRPVIEFLSPRAAYEDTIGANNQALADAQGHFFPFMTGFDEKRDLSARAAYLLGFGHGSLGRAASAIKIMEQAVHAEPGNAHFLVGLANQYRAGGSESKATGAYRRALEASPGEAEAAQDLAAILRGQGNDTEAGSVLQACLAAAPDAPGVLADLARLLLETGRSAQALPLLEKSLERDASAGTTHLLYGLALTAAGRVPEAVPHLRRARTALFDDAASQRAVGEALLVAGDLEEAPLAWTRATVLDPTNAESYIGLARTAQRRGDTAGEFAAIARAKEVDPANPLLAGR
jgi:spermidine synthase